jgi:hypothetical protein
MSEGEVDKDFDITQTKTTTNPLHIIHRDGTVQVYTLVLPRQIGTFCSSATVNEVIDELVVQCNLSDLTKQRMHVIVGPIRLNVDKLGEKTMGELFMGFGIREGQHIYCLTDPHELTGEVRTVMLPGNIGGYAAPAN